MTLTKRDIIKTLILSPCYLKISLIERLKLIKELLSRGL